MEGNSRNTLSLIKNVVLPVIVWAGVVVILVAARDTAAELTDTEKVAFRQLIKFGLTIAVPLLVIHLLYSREKGEFGLYFPKFSQSFKLSLTAAYVAAPACAFFPLIGLLGLEFKEWLGSAILGVVFLAVFFLVLKVTKSLPTRSSNIASRKGLAFFLVFGLVTVALTYLIHEQLPIVARLFYFVFIVAFGEELFFRGYLQSSFNQYFGKKLNIGEVRFGWGLFLSALLFGLIHALAATPLCWPWALFTAVLGLTLGYIREKDGSILAAVLLHAIIDFPLVFITK